MKEIIGDLFDPNTYRIMPPPTRGWVPCNFVPDAICITTNGFVKTNGQCVMGRGCAKTAAETFLNLPSRLGSYLSQYGNRVFDMGSMSDNVHLVTFPVKPVRERCTEAKGNVVRHMQNKFRPGDWVPGWACIADFAIIDQSCRELVELTNKRGWTRVVLPRPGAGAGQLKWEDVKKVIKPILDNRFFVITFPSRR